MFYLLIKQTTHKAMLLSFFSVSAFVAQAQVIPFSLFTDNTVLQRNIKVPVWGIAKGCKTVTVECNGQKKEADVIDGKWMVTLSPMKASSTPLEMRISCEKNEVVLHNIAIGEVWLAGGQSNMERQLGPRPPQKPLLNWEAEAAAANYPNIREFSLPHNGNALVPVTSIRAQWKVCDPKNVINFSAIGYYFAKQLHLQYNIPVGIIHSSWGGTPVEKWMSKELLQSNPEFAPIVQRYEQAITSFPSRLAFFNTNKDSIIAKWRNDSVSASMAKRPIPSKPATPVDPQLSGECGGLYKTMIEPLIPFAIKGVIWYQGEANVSNPTLYAKTFPAMIKDWRAKWNIGEFPFLFVQLAPFIGSSPELRESQLYTTINTPKTALVVTIDCGDSIDIHPANKKPVGDRLALAARAIAYGEKKLAYSGPVYTSFKANSNTIEISFTHIGKGLKCEGDSLIGFAISANGKDFVAAKAVIKKDKVVVSSPVIEKPIAVRYAFLKNPLGNLFNKDGLPASSFRTDTPFVKN